MRNSLRCYYRLPIVSIALEKRKKRMQYCLNYSGIGFCPLKIEMTQFPNGLYSVLILKFRMYLVLLFVIEVIFLG